MPKHDCIAVDEYMETIKTMRRDKAIEAIHQALVDPSRYDAGCTLHRKEAKTVRKYFKERGFKVSMEDSYFDDDLIEVTVEFPK